MSAVTITMPPVVRAADAEPPNALPPFDIEQVRVGLERTFAAALEAHPLFARVAAACTPPSDQEIRRHLMAASLRLSEAMAPEAYRVAHEARRILRVDGALELYQRSGPENAAMHRVAAPILLELHGSLMPRLDGPALLALIGHELGHYLAHGPASPPQPALRIPGGAVDEVTFEALQSRLSMACELTADRVALLACQDLGALLRLMLVTVSGLAVGELTYDTDAYLAQCKDLIEEDLRVGAVAKGDSHPEHGLRVYAAWLFSETRLYRELTGRGPGTREVADVDAVIARCLGTSGRRIHDPVQAADVPRELLECGLAAAVLVAQADSSVTEDEAILLERVFASEIPDWQSYLEPGVAAERFLDTAAVLVPIAQEIGPTLLNLLFAVMSADQAIEGREISMLLQIGACLGLREPFARRLIAMLRQRGIHLDLTTIAPPEQPLPARSQDVDEALHTFLAGVARRGETATTLRRMLRLLGSDRRDDDLIGRLVRTLVAQHISFTPALTDVGLDERVVLTPASAPPVRTSQAIAVSGSRAGLLAALRRLREQLVSGDGRSPSVRLRAVRRGRSFDLTALERVSVGLAERVMAQVRARKAVRVIDAADAGRHGPAAAITADLLALAREDLARTEETGARELYVGYPFVTGTVGGYLIRAPLVLYPVELTREGAGARGFRLEPRRDELPLANQSLIRLVFNKRGFAFSDELADELEALAGDPDGGPEAVRRRLAEVGLPLGDGAAALQPFGEVADTTLFGEQAPAIEEVAILGMFPQSSSDLLQDYDGLLHDLARPDAEIGALLGAAATLLPDGPTTTAVAAAAEVGPDWAPVIPADPSQRSVVAEARRHGATVIDGPPGTGKSQVIVNLVAEAVRRGERVAVVCEKRAALDVVRQRMTAIGFGKALAVVHDVYEDRKPLFAHITGRLEAAGKVPFAAAEADAVHAEHAKVRDALAQRSEALRMTPDGLELSVGELLALQAEHARTDVPPVAGLDHVTQAGLRTLLDATVALQPLVDLWGPGGRWPVGGVRPRRSLATGAPTVVADLEAAIAAALPLAQAFEQRQAGLPSALSLEQIDAARAALTEAVRSRPLRGDERDAATFGTIAQLAATDPERLRATAQAREALREDTTALVRLDRPVTFGGGPELVASLSVLSRWSRSWYRIFIGAWRRARQRVRTELTERWPERAGDPLTPDLIDAIRDRLAASRAWKTIGDVFARLGLAHLVPAHAGELAPAIERVASMADSLRGLAAARPALAAIGAWLPEGPQTAASLAAWDRRVDDRLAMLAARDALRDAAAALAPWFPGLAVLPSAAELGELLAAWRRDAARVAEADGLLVRAGAALPAAGELLAAVAAACADRPASGWRSAVLGAWAAGWVARLEHEQPVLAGLGHGADDREIDRLAARLRELETERRELEIERTLARLDRAELLEVEAAAKHARRTPAQKAREDLLKEARKQRLLMPLRTFVRRFAPIGLLDVTPVWLLSPETMAILFPRQALFDLVVFDEASQCTVEAGLPVLLRARRVVIAGDEKQMPPSSYFALGGVDEDESLAGGVEADERHDTLRDLLTAESLLSLARPRVAHTGLAWHYRCRDEALIAFSNHAMYQGELLTIPSTAGTAAPSALHWVPVTGGTYQGGENTAEATRVVDVVDELLARSPRPSIGVVTFNLRQRKAVLDAIDARRAADEQFAARWTDASALPLDERPFVRNLEQVQGDERDVIVFSLGHAPQARFRGGAATGEVYVPARFGPLGQRGGERRLNVAISRARLACYLVSSFEPGQLTVSSSRNEGPRLFKHFLEFAHHHHHGRRLEAARVLELVRSHARVEAAGRHRLPVDGFTPLQTQLALALEAAGIPYELDVGASGFRIPIALLDPADPTRFALAVLLEDGTGGADPFDLHVHRPGVLRQRGWKVVTVSAASWLRRGVEVLAELEAQVPGCRGAVTGDVYVRHREAMARPLGPTGVTNPIPVPGRRPDASRSATPVDDEGAVDDRAAASGPVATSEPVAALPPWARDISDELFRAALLYLDGHGTLHEGELMGMVGGPRRARAFVGLLDGWRHTLPFAIEVSDLAGANVYKKVPRSAPAGAPQEAAPVTA